MHVMYTLLLSYTSSPEVNFVFVLKTESHYVAQAVLKIPSLLLPWSTCREYRSVPSHSQIYSFPLPIELKLEGWLSEFQHSLSQGLKAQLQLQGI